MRIPRYWARGYCSGVDRQGKEQTFQACGWSSDSFAAAEAVAAARAKRSCDALRSERELGAYEYLEQPLREEVVESIGPLGEETAIVTRNRYGALVLNSRSVCFVDVDFPKAKPTGVLDALLLLFSAPRRRDRTRAVQRATVQGVRDWFAGHADRSSRVYQTAAGLRVLFTDRCYDPVSGDASALFEELGSDVLYRKLTLKQECFRARLTPKPWRCGCPRPPNRYPWHTADDERQYRGWQRDYEAQSKGYATCRLLATLGACSPEAPIAGIVELHDRYTCRGDDVKLA